MNLNEIERENQRLLKEYIREWWGDKERILAFIVTLLDEGSFYARQVIESMGEEAYEKWNDGTNYEESIAMADVRIIDNMRKEMDDLILWSVILDDDVVDYLGERYYATRIHDLSRIMVTEHTRIEAEQEIKRGEVYVYHCVHDERTCPECIARDGQVYFSSDADIGLNMPPMHPWCRCWVTTGVPSDEWTNSDNY